MSEIKTLNGYNFVDTKAREDIATLAEEIDSGTGSVQADWNENDPASKAYVQNRTHWAEVGAAEVYTNFTGTVADNVIAFTEPYANCPQAGEECVVTWNGVEYRCTPEEYTEDGITPGVVLGDLSAMGITSTSTGEPFFMLICFPEYVEMLDGIYGMAMPTDGSTTATISISFVKETIQKIDEKFLPIQKTHWVNEEDVVIYENAVIQLDGNGEGALLVRPKTELSVGTTYKVIWNGTEYEAPCEAVNNTYFKYILGVENVFTMNFLQDNLIAQMNGTVAMVLATATGETNTITFSAAEPVGAVHKIDIAFLPDDVVNAASVATTAQTTATAAQETATTAQTTATAAQETAGNALTVATAAQETAENALEAATASGAVMPEFSLVQTMTLEEGLNEIAIDLGKKCRSLYCIIDTPKVDVSEFLHMRIGASNEAGMGIHVRVHRLLSDSEENLYGFIKIDCVKGLILCMTGATSSAELSYENIQLQHSAGTSVAYLTKFYLRRSVASELFPVGTKLSVYAQEF